MAVIEREPTRAPVGEPATMKAAVVESFTAPLELKEVPKPTNDRPMRPIPAACDWWWNRPSPALR